MSSVRKGSTRRASGAAKSDLKKTSLKKTGRGDDVDRAAAHPSQPLPSFTESNARFERWLASQIPLVKKDLLLKHERMGESAFPFLRATFFRWCELWMATAPLLGRELGTSFTAGPQILGVGDLHLENFGTWRDAEGRLIWGINDFDEASHYPFLFDLVRLATSAAVAIEEKHLKFPLRDAVDAIFVGYEEGLKQGGRGFILEESHPWLREMATSRLRSPEAFWAKMEKLKTTQGASAPGPRTSLKNSKKTSKTTALPVRAGVPEKLARVLKAHLPEGVIDVSLVPRVAGLGSLGRERLVAICDLNGGRVAREIKWLMPSAWSYASGQKDKAIHYGQILAHACREKDPFLFLPTVKNGTKTESFVVRRLAPHCIKIELDSIPRRPDEVRLFEAMGFEVANIHLGSASARSLLDGLARVKPRDLRELVQRMFELTSSDFKEWKKR